MESAAEKTSPALLREDRDGVATLTLNRPEARNALSRELLGELRQALDAIAPDSTVRVVVLAGAGTAFSAGHDLAELRANPDREFRATLLRECAEAMIAITRLPQPVIARVHGIATAAGCQLVATTDLAVASAEARFATPGVQIGLFCSTPMVALSRNVSRKQAMQMLLTGEAIDAETALAYGLVNRVVPTAELDTAVGDLAAKLVSKSKVPISIGKEAFYRQLEMPLEEAYRTCSEVMLRNLEARDAGEGISAFLEKRKPRWQDR